MIANDELWHDQRMAMPAYNVDLNMTFMQKASPWHGQLSPVMFLASLTGSGTQNYSSPELLYLFDESEGQFMPAIHFCTGHILLLRIRLSLFWETVPFTGCYT